MRGTPEGAEDSANAAVPWINLESITNTNGQLLTSGFLYDHPADGFAGFSFNVVTYPGLAILITVLAINLIGDGLRDALDPKLKRS